VYLAISESNHCAADSACRGSVEQALPHTRRLPTLYGAQPHRGDHQQLYTSERDRNDRRSGGLLHVLVRFSCRQHRVYTLLFHCMRWLGSLVSALEASVALLSTLCPTHYCCLLSALRFLLSGEPSAEVLLGRAISCWVLHPRRTAVSNDSVVLYLGAGNHQYKTTTSSERGSTDTTMGQLQKYSNTEHNSITNTGLHAVWGRSQLTPSRSYVSVLWWSLQASEGAQSRLQQTVVPQSPRDTNLKHSKPSHHITLTSDEESGPTGINVRTRLQNCALCTHSH
jgi:hypothetical protein